MKKWLTFILAALMAVTMAIGLTACGGNDDVVASEMTVFIGETKALDIKKSGGDTISCKSDNTDVATVEDQTGKVTGVSIGEANISVTVFSGTKTKKGTCKVKVTEDTSKMFTVDFNSETSTLGEFVDPAVLTLSFHDNGKMKLSGLFVFYNFTMEFDYSTQGGQLKVSPIENFEFRNDDLLQDTSGFGAAFARLPIEDIKAEMNASVMTIHFDAKSNDYPNGRRTIGMFDLAGHEVELGVTFGEKKPVESVTVAPATLDMTVGDVRQLAATIAPADATFKTVTWTSSDNETVSVADGKITALKAGSNITITATSTDDNTKSASCTVTVAEAPAGTLVVKGQTAADGTWTTLRFTEDGATLKGQVAGNAQKAVDVSATYTLTDKKLTAIADGTLTLDSKTYTVKFTVADGENGAVNVFAEAVNNADENDKISLGLFTLSSADVAELVPALVKVQAGDATLKFYDGGRLAVHAAYQIFFAVDFETTYTVNDGTLTIGEATGINIKNPIDGSAVVTNGKITATVATNGKVEFTIAYNNGTEDKADKFATYKLTTEQGTILDITVVDDGPTAALQKNSNADSFVLKFFDDKSFTIEGTTAFGDLAIKGTFGVDNSWQLAFTITEGTLGDDSHEYTITVEGTEDRTVTVADKASSLSLCAFTISATEITTTLFPIITQA